MISPSIRAFPPELADVKDLCIRYRYVHVMMTYITLIGLKHCAVLSVSHCGVIKSSMIFLVWSLC